MKGMDSCSARQQLAWSTVHEDQRLEDYFSSGQAAHLRTARGTVVCTDWSVKLSYRTLVLALFVLVGACQA
eukprot:3704217-Rhodomonas_salina.1